MDAQAQAEIDRLKSEVAELRKALGNKQQLSPPNLPSLRDNFEFVTDMARFSEGIATESAVRKKHHFDEATWERLASDEQLIERATHRAHRGREATPNPRRVVQA